MNTTKKKKETVPACIICNVPACIICKKSESWYTPVRPRRTNGPVIGTRSGQQIRAWWIGQMACDSCVRKAHYQEKKNSIPQIPFSKDELFASAFSVLVDTEPFLV